MSKQEEVQKDEVIIQQTPMLDNDSISEILDLNPVQTLVETDSTEQGSKFKPKFTKKETASEEHEQQQTASVDFNIDARIKQLEKQLEEAIASLGGDVKLKSPTKKPVKLDYAKLKESDIYDLDIPIPVITHELPDTMLLSLKDPNYVGRWVSVNAHRLGSMKAIGFSFITTEDFDKELILAIEPDENGWYRYNDVVAMKIPKEKYYSAIRRNHIRAMAMVSRKQAQLIGKKIVEQELATGVDAEGHTHGRDYQKYSTELGSGGRPKMEVYI